MAAFATDAAAETRAYAARAAGTWINAHAGRGVTGTILVRVQRPLSPSAPSGGDWVEITDNGTD